MVVGSGLAGKLPETFAQLNPDVSGSSGLKPALRVLDAGLSVQDLHLAPFAA